VALAPGPAAEPADALLDAGGPGAAREAAAGPGAAGVVATGPGAAGVVALAPGPAAELAEALDAAGRGAGDLAVALAGLLADAGEAAPRAAAVLDGVAGWGAAAAADLRWRVEVLTALDGRGADPAALRAGVLALAGPQHADRAATLHLDRLLAAHAGADPRTRADAVAAWAAALPAGLLAVLAHRAPDRIGGLDGVPPAARYAANRRLVAAALADVEARLAAPGRPDGREDLEDRRRALASLLGPAPDGGDRQLLAFDPVGDGRAVEVLGDLEDADHVAVLVPGILTTLDGFDRLAVDAHRLRRRATAMGSGGAVATVAWLGYDAPGHLDAVATVAARRAGPGLAGFLDAQRLAPQVHTTVVGHSYGSVVTGHALGAGMAADDVVVLGSPGIGVPVAAGVTPEGGGLYAIRTADDPVAWSRFHGPDPAGPAFGATVLAANAPGWTPISGHSAYYAVDSASLDNLAAVVVDLDDRLVPQTDAFSDPVHAEVEGRALRAAEDVALAAARRVPWPRPVLDLGDAALDAANHAVEATVDEVTGRVDLVDGAQR